MRKLEKLSIVVPCFNEQEVIESTHQRLSAILKSLASNSKCAAYEILYVNDGSSDQTQKLLDEIFAKDRNVRVVVLRRNFGLQGALSAGLCLCTGEAVVTIDSDLQDPPEKIEEMITYYEQGYDLVLGVREDRQSDSFLKRFTAENYYLLLKILGVQAVYNHADFRLMARPLVEELNRLTERNRYIRSLVLSLDNHYASVFYKRQPRLQGVTKFNFAKMLSLSLDGIFSFSFVPLRLISFLGLGFCVLSLFGSVLFLLSGVQLLCLGIIGEYISRLYTEAKQRPLFIVRRELAHPQAPDPKS